MFRIFAFLFLTGLSRLSFAQDVVVRDTVPFAFWGSTFWKYSNAVDQITDPLNNSLISVRKYYPNNFVSEEYLRVDDTTWLYQQYDSIESSRLLCRGLYVADPEAQLQDSELKLQLLSPVEADNPNTRNFSAQAKKLPRASFQKT